MKKLIRISFAVLAILLACAMPGQADHHHGGGHGGWGWGPALGLGLLGLGLWELTYPHYYQPPVVVRQPPQQLYIQPPPQPTEQSYWYYCQEAQGYYPYVRQCPGGWMKVVPSPPPPQW